ncbi:MAG: hypothetical protein LUD48_00220 [Prevotella sp.]|nr:hypothetical protein [Prevotella sp.]
MFDKCKKEGIDTGDPVAVRKNLSKIEAFVKEANDTYHTTIPNPWDENGNLDKNQYDHFLWATAIIDSNIVADDLSDAPRTLERITDKKE